MMRSIFFAIIATGIIFNYFSWSMDSDWFEYLFHDDGASSSNRATPRHPQSATVMNPILIYPDYMSGASFEEKLGAFRRKLHQMRSRWIYTLTVQRHRVFEDSMELLSDILIQRWKDDFMINFAEEDGHDMGGLLREWYSIMTRSIVDPKRGLFVPASGDGGLYTINPSCPTDDNHLRRYRFVGRFIGKALLDKVVLDLYFTRSIYKHIAGRHVECKDLEVEDPILYRNLERMRKQTVAEINEELGYELTFSMEIPQDGSIVEQDLVPNGRNVFVTDRDKEGYIELVCQMKLYGTVSSQLNAFLDGFDDIIDHRLVSVFTEHELGLLIGGSPTIDINDLQEHTMYAGYTSKSPQIVWFWDTLRSFNQSQLASFLRFATGSPKAPLGGFVNLPRKNFTISYESTNRLISAMTCVNLLVLPAYRSQDMLREQLERSLREPLSFRCQ